MGRSIGNGGKKPQGLLKYWNEILMRAVKFAQEFFLGYSGFAGLALLNICFSLLIVRGRQKENINPRCVWSKDSRRDLDSANQSSQMTLAFRTELTKKQGQKWVWDTHFVGEDLAGFTWLWGHQWPWWTDPRFQLRQGSLWSQ